MVVSSWTHQLFQKRFFKNWILSFISPLETPDEAVLKKFSVSLDLQLQIISRYSHVVIFEFSPRTKSNASWWSQISIGRNSYSDTSSCNANMRTETNICSFQNTEARFRAFLNSVPEPKRSKKIFKRSSIKGRRNINCIYYYCSVNITRKQTIQNYVRIS